MKLTFIYNQIKTLIWYVFHLSCIHYRNCSSPLMVSDIHIITVQYSYKSDLHSMSSLVECMSDIWLITTVEMSILVILRNPASYRSAPNSKRQQTSSQKHTQTHNTTTYWNCHILQRGFQSLLHHVDKGKDSFLSDDNLCTNHSTLHHHCSVHPVVHNTYWRSAHHDHNVTMTDNIE